MKENAFDVVLFADNLGNVEGYSLSFPVRV